MDLDMPPFQVPPGLAGVPQQDLEDLRAQWLHQITGALRPHLMPLMRDPSEDTWRRAIGAARQDMGPLRYGALPPLRIEFRHQCRSLSCPPGRTCSLCANDASRGCTRTFAPRYLSHEAVAAECGGPLAACLVDAGGAVYEGPLQGVFLEVMVVDARGFEREFPEEDDRRAALRLDDSRLGDLLLLTNGGREATAEDDGGDWLLVDADPQGARNDAQGRLVLHPTNGACALPRRMQFTSTSEALIQGRGRAPPMRLLARARHRGGRPLPIEPAASEDFVVATRRAGCDAKPAIPFLDGHISKIVRVGDKTIKKLANLGRAAEEARVVLPSGCPHHVRTVQQLKEMMAAVDAMTASAARTKLLKLVGMSQEVWQEVCDHTSKAVPVDNNMRLWLDQSSAVGALYCCKRGKVDLDGQPAALLMPRRPGPHQQRTPLGAADTSAAAGPLQAPPPALLPFSVVLAATLRLGNPQQAAFLHAVHGRAVEAWKEEGHPGWERTALGPARMAQIGSGSITLEEIRGTVMTGAPAPALAAAVPPPAIAAAAAVAAAPPAAAPDAAADQQHHPPQVLLQHPWQPHAHQALQLDTQPPTPPQRVQSCDLPLVRLPQLEGPPQQEEDALRAQQLLQQAPTLVSHHWQLRGKNEAPSAVSLDTKVLEDLDQATFDNAEAAEQQLRSGLMPRAGGHQQLDTRRLSSLLLPQRQLSGPAAAADAADSLLLTATARPPPLPPTQQQQQPLKQDQQPQHPDERQPVIASLLPAGDSFKELLAWLEAAGGSCGLLQCSSLQQSMEGIGLAAGDSLLLPPPVHLQQPQLLSDDVPAAPTAEGPITPAAATAAAPLAAARPAAVAAAGGEAAAGGGGTGPAKPLPEAADDVPQHGTAASIMGCSGPLGKAAALGRIVTSSELEPPAKRARGVAS